MSWDDLVEALPLFTEGALNTLWLTVATLVLGFVVALPVAFGRNARGALARWPATAFVFAFRGAPLLALLYLVYYGAPEVPLIRETWAWALFREPIPCAVTALSLNSAGYLAEVIAGALRSVPRGPVEAARALGLPRARVFRHVTAPLAVRLGLRAYGNEVVFVLKGTSVASLVTVTDVMAAANQTYFRTLDPYGPFLLAGTVYLAVVLVIGWAVRAGEARLRLR